MGSAAALSWFLVTSLTGLGILLAPTTPAEALVCVPRPASALEDLDYRQFSGDWREVLRSKHGPVLLQKGSWRFDFDTNTFAFSAALAGNATCLPAIVGKVHKVLPVGQFVLDYDFFGQPVQETLAVVATDYGSYAILHRCAHGQPHASVCPPDATHTTVLARHVLEDDTPQEIKRHLEAICVAVSMLEPHEFDEACPLPPAEDPSLAVLPPGTKGCFLEPKRGFCSGTLTIFYYDREQRSCQNLTVRGCEANENHFLTHQECVEKCEKPLEQARVRPVESESAQCPVSSTCGLACPQCCQRKDNDSCIVCSCLASETETTLKKADCLAAPEVCPAGCQSREVSASCYACECAAADGTVQLALEYVDVQIAVPSCPVTCVKRVSSSGVDSCHCPSDGTCKLPVKEGNCNGSIPRYFFNASSGFCDVFYYTGCGGNENSFASHEECIAECEDPCRLPMDPGSCNDTQERYYYNSQTGLCETFEYSGCEGNKNNFEVLDACKNTCEDVCSQPQDSGPCYAYLRRFYYDKQEDRCLPFIFGGCLGNGNNFFTSTQCNRRCRLHVADEGVIEKDREMCHQQLDEGHCDEASSGSGTTSQEIRFYYDVQKEQCERFNYQGCGGNDNNFRTMDGCNMTCFGVHINAAKTAASCPESTQCDCSPGQDGKCENAPPHSSGATHLAMAFVASASVTASLFTL